MAITTVPLTPEGTGQCHLCGRMPLLASGSPNLLPRSTAGPRLGSRSSSSAPCSRRPPDRHFLDPRREAQRPVPAVLHDHRCRRQKGRVNRGPVAREGGRAPPWRSGTPDLRTRRYPDATLRAARTGGRHPSQPNAWTGGAPYVYGHVWVVLGLLVVHPAWGVIALPLLAQLYVRKKNLIGIPPNPKFERAKTGISTRGNGLRRIRFPVSGYISINFSAAACNGSASVS